MHACKNGHYSVIFQLINAMSFIDQVEHGEGTRLQ